MVIFKPFFYYCLCSANVYLFIAKRITSFITYFLMNLVFIVILFFNICVNLHFYFSFISRLLPPVTSYVMVETALLY